MATRHLEQYLVQGQDSEMADVRDVSKMAEHMTATERFVRATGSESFSRNWGNFTGMHSSNRAGRELADTMRAHREIL